MTKILLIPDVHCKPDTDLSYLANIGHFAVEKKPPTIVCIGDWADMPSLSSYDVGKKCFEGRRYKKDIQASIEGMQCLLEPIEEYNRKLRREKRAQYKPRMVMITGNHCLSEDTTTYVKDKGWVNYTQLEIGDEVLSLDNSENYEWNSIKNIIKYKHTGIMRTFNSTQASMSVTEGHRVYHYDYKDTLKVKLASELVNQFKLATSSNSSTSVSLSDVELQLAAWLCTDSHFSNRHGSITLYQRESNSYKIEDILNKAGVSYTKKIRNRIITSVCGRELLKPPEAGVEIYISKENSKALSERLKVYNNYELPEWVFKCSNSQWDIFMHELVEADGHFTGGPTDAHVFFGKLKICEDVMLQAQLHGWRASLKEYRPGHFRVNLAKSNKSHIKLQDTQYTGMVWCLEVDNKNFLVRRNNKLHFTGNCERINRAINNDPKLEGTIGVEDLKYAEFGWEVYPFLEVVNIHDIMFSHYFTSGVMGRPVASAKSMLMKKHMSCVMGHVQTHEIANMYRADGSEIVGLFCGTAYECDHDYLGPQGNNHFRGIWVLKNVKDGAFSPVPYTLEELRKRYE